MPIEFDPVNKWILLPDLSDRNYTITAQEIYNAAMDWAESPEAMGYDLPMSATGYANLGGGAYTDKIFILINGWKLKPYPGNYTLTVIGTIIALDEQGNPVPRTVPPDSGQVQWVFQVSSQGIIAVTGSGVTQQDKIDIANLVEQQTGQPIKQVINPMYEEIEIIKKHDTLRRRVEGNYILYFEGDRLVFKYRMIRDEEGNVIEVIPEVV